MTRFKFLFIFMATTVCLCGLNTLSAAETENNKEKVAVVNGSVISKHDYDVSFNALVKELSTNAQRQLTDSELARIKGNVLEKLIDQKILYQAAKKENIQIDEAAYQQQVAQLNAGLKKDPALQAEIEKTKYSMEEIQNQIRENLMVNQFINEKFFNPVVVSDEAVKAYYENNKTQFVYPEKISARHILIKPALPDNKDSKAEALKKIESIQDKLKAGEDFETLARAHSQCPSKEKGGDLGFFSRGQMVPPFEEAAFALNINEISDIVETQFGYHLIQLTGKVPETTIEFNEIKDRLKPSLKKQKAMENLEAFLNDAKKNGTIELFLK